MKFYISKIIGKQQLKIHETILFHVQVLKIRTFVTRKFRNSKQQINKF